MASTNDPKNPLEVHHGEVLINQRRFKISDLAHEFSPRFEGNESETNWRPRQESIILLRRLTASSAPQKYRAAYITAVKGLQEGIIKAVASLRTTLSTHGMRLVVEAVEKCGSDLDSTVEFIIHPLIKQCGNTRVQAASEASIAVSTVLTHTTYTSRILQHISHTMDEKNKALRGFAIGWLDAVLSKYSDSRYLLEEKGGADIVQKLVNKSLTDADATVRTKSESVYWTYSSIWPARAEVTMGSLTAAKQKSLLAHQRNPNRSSVSEKSTDTSAINRQKVARAATAMGNRSDRPSVRDHIKAQKKKVLEQPTEPTREQSRQQQALDLVDSLNEQRPKSAGSMNGAGAPAKPIRPTARPIPARPKTAASTISSSTGTLSSAPKRPILFKKANTVATPANGIAMDDHDVTKTTELKVELSNSMIENIAPIPIVPTEPKRGRPLSVIANPPDLQNRPSARVEESLSSASPERKEKDREVKIEKPEPSTEPEVTEGFVRVLVDLVSDQGNQVPENAIGTFGRAVKSRDVNTRQIGFALGVALHKRLGESLYSMVSGLDDGDKNFLAYFIGRDKRHEEL